MNDSKTREAVRVKSRHSLSYFYVIKTDIYFRSRRLV